uniref:Carrier domain-containing protein n=1 Tax=Chromera velia CCMP2878 TaxID=1169474 RepID=A0A0G4F601_9ALVE|eukprot:Cvel_15255.t1-p1 / transcript=Cvel_15255.t1 / gene=Cvel_15255 / organism=Chromera_velia_CCMP2878 / gene_product=Erythronolide synthase, modules 1 and 2, putative / transcript_product=Erythronolide synthase, modules 1 and 2, putative / location=Cvel_scaffold1118:61-9673(+) / protein_length=2854 / sequence_SO=supercontig / SO=protein_coding / is_pseudo=false
MCSASFWAEHVLAPVRFLSALRTVAACAGRATDRDSRPIFVEVGPRPTLINMARQCLAVSAGANKLPSVISWECSQDPQRDSRKTFQAAADSVLAALKQQGEKKANTGSLPTEGRVVHHGWNHKAWPWTDAGHPLLGPLRSSSPACMPGSFRFEGPLGREICSLLDDHRVCGRAVVPAAAILEVAAAAAEEEVRSRQHEFSEGGVSSVVIRELAFERPILLPAETQLEASSSLVLGVKAEDGGSSGFRVSVYSKEENDREEEGDEDGEEADVDEHAEGQVVPVPPANRNDGGAERILEALRSRCPDAVRVEPEGLYRFLFEQGLEYGPRFRTVQSLSVSLTSSAESPPEALCRLEVPSHLSNFGETGFRLHPSLIDGALQCASFLSSGGTPEASQQGKTPQQQSGQAVKENRRPFIPASVEEARIDRVPAGRPLWAHVCLRKKIATESGGSIADVRLFDEQSGAQVGILAGVRFQRADLSKALRPPPRVHRNLLWEVQWEMLSMPEGRAENGPGKDLTISGKPILFISCPHEGAAVAAFKERLQSLQGTRGHAILHFGDLPPQSELESLLVGGRFARVISLAGAFPGTEEGGEAAEVSEGIAELLQVTRALHSVLSRASESSDSSPSRDKGTVTPVLVVTRGAWSRPLPASPVEEQRGERPAANPLRAGLWGFCRSARLELCKLGVSEVATPEGVSVLSESLLRCADLEGVSASVEDGKGGGLVGEVRRVLEGFAVHQKEEELLLLRLSEEMGEGQTLMAPRLHPSDAAPSLTERGGPCELTLSPSYSDDDTQTAAALRTRVQGLRREPAEAPLPSPEEIEVRLRAVFLSRDSLESLKLVSGRKLSGHTTVKIPFAGTVVQSGPSVAGLKGGDDVTGFLSVTLSEGLRLPSHCKAPASECMKAPESILLEDACIPADSSRHRTVRVSVGEQAVGELDRAVEGVLSGDSGDSLLFQFPSAVGEDSVRVRDGAVAVTGGFGALGLLVARWLVEEGVKRLVLVSRRGEPDKVTRESETFRWLSSSSARVIPFRCDVARGTECKRLVEGIRDLRGIVHAAGVLEDGSIPQQDSDKLRRVFAGKAEGAWNLHRASEASGVRLDFFVLFSSVVGLLGNFGQSGYGAANAALDALAEYRRARGLSAHSIQWGPWREQGMGAGGVAAAHFERSGMPAVSNGVGLSVLSGVVRSSSAVVVCCQELKWNKFLQRYGQTPALLERAAPAVTQKKAAIADCSTQSSPLSSLPEEELRQHVSNVVVETAADILGRGAGELPLDAPLQQLGVDSLAAVEMRNALASKLAPVRLPATALFDYPTLSAVIGFNIRKLRELAPVSTPSSATTAESSVGIRVELEGVPRDDGRPSSLMGVPLSLLPSGSSLSMSSELGLAVTGMACRFPGGVTSPDEFWEMMERKADCMGPIPASRWNHSEWFDPEAGSPGVSYYMQEAAFLEGGEKFDNDFFGIPAVEVPSMDPQQRVMMEVAQEAFDSARFSADWLRDRNVGVYIGVFNHDWHLVTQDTGSLRSSAFTATGTYANVIANRVSFFFGTRGPSMAIDTACSASLVALDLGVQQLRSHGSEAALCGGVNMMLSPQAFVACCKARMLSAESRCKTFDENANGYARGEGCGAVVLKLLHRAVRDGDPVRAVVRGSASNHVGRSMSLTAPNGPAQVECIQRALNTGGVRASEVSFVETHGTGTSLGDPIEMGALREVYGEGRRSDSPLVLGAVKTNIGHLEGAAGIAGFIKLVLVLQHRSAPPNLHLKTLNPHLDVDGFPVVFPKEKTALSSGLVEREGGALLGAVSSFGFGGANAHVVVEGRPAPPAEAAPSSESSAKPFVVFLFTGQGSQSIGMGKGLFESEPVFRRALERCAGVLDPLLSIPLLALLYPPEGSSKEKSEAVLNETQNAQPALFALEWALFELWRSRGVEPSAVMGHSLGELVAATAAGVMRLEDALWLVAERARVMAASPKNGGVMVACRSSAGEFESALSSVEASPGSGCADVRQHVSLAAENGPQSIVVSGREAEVELVIGALGQTGRARRLRVSHAFHSPLMAEAAGRFGKAVEEKGEAVLSEPVKGVSLVSCLTGEEVGSEMCSASFWAEHVLAPVRFLSALRTVAACAGRATDSDSRLIFVEVGPRPTLINMGRRGVPFSPSTESFWFSSLDPSAGQTAEGGSDVFHIACKSVVAQTQQRSPQSQSTRKWNHKAWPWPPVRHPSVMSGSRSASSVPVSARDSFDPSNVGVGTGDAVARGVSQIVVETATEILGREVGEGETALPLDAPLQQLGLDSLAAVEMRNALASKLAPVRLPAAFVSEQPTLSALSDFLTERVRESASSRAASERPPEDGNEKGEKVGGDLLEEKETETRPLSMETLKGQEKGGESLSGFRKEFEIPLCAKEHLGSGWRRVVPPFVKNLFFPLYTRCYYAAILEFHLRFHEREVDPLALRRVLVRLFEEHPILRARVKKLKGTRTVRQWCAHVPDEAEVIEERDVNRDLPFRVLDQEDRWDRVRTQQRKAISSLDHLLCAFTLVLPTSTLHINIHHAIADLHTVILLARSIAGLYARAVHPSRQRGRTGQRRLPDLPRPEETFVGRVTEWQRESAPHPIPPSWTINKKTHFGIKPNMPTRFFMPANSMRCFESFGPLSVPSVVQSLQQTSSAPSAGGGRLTWRILMMTVWLKAIKRHTGRHSKMVVDEVVDPRSFDWLPPEFTATWGSLATVVQWELEYDETASVIENARRVAESLKAQAESAPVWQKAFGWANGRLGRSEGWIFNFFEIPDLSRLGVSLESRTPPLWSGFHQRDRSLEVWMTPPESVGRGRSLSFKILFDAINFTRRRVRRFGDVLAQEILNFDAQVATQGRE